MVTFLFNDAYLIMLYYHSYHYLPSIHYVIAGGNHGRAFLITLIAKDSAILVRNSRLYIIMGKKLTETEDKPLLSRAKL